MLLSSFSHMCPVPRVKKFQEDLDTYLSWCADSDVLFAAPNPSPPCSLPPCPFPDILQLRLLHPATTSSVLIVRLYAYGLRVASGRHGRMHSPVTARPCPAWPRPVVRLSSPYRPWSFSFSSFVFAMEGDSISQNMAECNPGALPVPAQSVPVKPQLIPAPAIPLPRAFYRSISLHPFRSVFFCLPDCHVFPPATPFAALFLLPRLCPHKVSTTSVTPSPSSINFTARKHPRFFLAHHIPIRQHI